MNDDELLRGIARAAREERAEADPPSTPISADARERMALAILGGAASKPDASGVEAKVPAGSSKPAVRARTWTAGRVVFLFAPIAAAAALVLYLRSNAAGDLPAYAVMLSSSTQSDRAAARPATDETVLQPDAWFELVARPAEPIANVVAEAVMKHDGTTTAFPGKVDVSDEGAVRLSGHARSVFPETNGSYEIVVTVRRRDGKAERTVRGHVRFAR